MLGCASVKADSKIDSKGELTFGAHFPIPGEMQTAPRGEVFTLVESSKQSNHNSDIIKHTDKKLVYEHVHEIIRMFAAPFYQQSNQLSVQWMPPHLDLGKKEWPDDITKSDVKGNKLADKLAGQAAAMVKVPVHIIITGIYDYYNVVKHIQKIFSAINRNPNIWKHYREASAVNFIRLWMKDPKVIPSPYDMKLFQEIFIRETKLGVYKNSPDEASWDILDMMADLHKKNVDEDMSLDKAFGLVNPVGNPVNPFAVPEHIERVIKDMIENDKNQENLIQLYNLY